MALARGFLAALILAALPARASIPELDQAPLLGPSTVELVDAVQAEAEPPAPPAPARPSAAASFQVRIVAPSNWPFGGPQHPCVHRDPLRVPLWNSTCVMGYPVRPFWPVGPENRVIGIFSAPSLQAYWNQQFSAQTAVDRSEDDFDRMTSTTDRWGNQIRYSYDANGNRVQLTDPQSKVTRYTFDALNRLSTVVIPEAGTTEYQYYRNSRLKKVAYPNGTSANYTFDGANRVTRIENLQGTALVSRFEYTYDLNHNRTQQIEEHSGQPAETTTYAYDQADRLLDVHYPEKTTTYTYDDVGNRLTEVEVDPAGVTIADKIFSYNNRNQLYQLDNGLDPTRSVTYGFDANGNQIQRTTAAGEVTDFGFDVRNQVIQVTKDGTSLGAYGYDFQGLRISKITADGLARYIYDDQSVLTRTDADGVTKFDYGPDRLLSVSDPTEGRAFYLFDSLGSVTNLTTPAGILLARYKYDAWGNYRSQVDNEANPFGFTGHEVDDETGLIYAKARFLDPELGIFLSEDPVAGSTETPPSLHRYLYAYQNPLHYVDLDGRKPGDWWDPRSYADANWKQVGNELWNVASLGTLNRVRAQKNLGTWSGLAESTFNGARSVSNTASFGLQDSIYETQMREGPGLKSIRKGAEQAVVDVFPVEETVEITVNWDRLSTGEKVRVVSTGVSKTAIVAAVAVGGVRYAQERTAMPAKAQPSGGNGRVLTTGEAASPASGASTTVEAPNAPGTERIPAEVQPEVRLPDGRTAGVGPGADASPAGSAPDPFVKPKHAPNVKKWEAKGGTVEQNLDGSVTYTDWEGNSVVYRGGEADFGPHSRAEVEIENMQGDHYFDYKAANKAAGYGEGAYDHPDGTTWHHKNTTTMQNADSTIHDRFSHKGAVSDLKNQNGGG